MNRLQRLQYERHIVSDTLRKIDQKIMDERLKIGLIALAGNKEVLKAININLKEV